MTDIVEVLDQFGGKWPYGTALAEIKRLRQFKLAYDEWVTKTEWVQEEAKTKYLGMHRADAMREEIMSLRQQVADLERRLQRQKESLTDHIVTNISLRQRLDERLLRAVALPMGDVCPLWTPSNTKAKEAPTKKKGGRKRKTPPPCQES
jgi:hypothetical protein